MQLRKTMASTNVIEPAFSIVEQVCKNVKRWHGGDRRERWVGSGLLVAEKQFRRVQGYKQIPALMRELEALTTSKPEVSFAARDGDMPVGVQNVPIHNARVDTASVEFLTSILSLVRTEILVPDRISPGWAKAATDAVSNNAARRMAGTENWPSIWSPLT
jgi:hypothetical protein